MPFSFVLPTTSNLPFSFFLSSTTHSSLPLAASTNRAVVKSALKKHKRLGSYQAKASNLGTVLSAFNEYVPYLWTLMTAMSDTATRGEHVALTLQKEVEVEWRSSLTAAAIVPGQVGPRKKGHGLDFEFQFTLHTIACLYSLQARAQLLTLYAAVTPLNEQRIAIITAATKSLLQANSIHACVASHSLEVDASSAVLETLSQTQSGLAALALAEATLLAVLKDDPYPAVVMQERNKNDKDWMIKPPEIPKVRAHLFARLCLSAAEHATKAEAMLSASGRIEEALIIYVSDLKKTARAKACRLFGIHAEMEGETGTAIAWLIGGKKQLGFAINGERSKVKGLAKLRRDWADRKEDRKIEKGGAWGSDAGLLEESRVIEMLETKWNKMNDMINTQPIPSSDLLVATMPLGRDMYTTKSFVPPLLDEEILTRLRAPPEQEDHEDDDESSSDEDERLHSSSLPGAFSDTSPREPSYF